MSFLAEASRLLADSLDYETTLATVATLSLPYLGAWCIVDIYTEGEMRRAAVVHSDPEMQALARRLEAGWPPERDDPFGVPRAFRTRETEVIADLPDEMLVEVSRGEDNLQILRSLGLGSLLVVPLLARGEVLGAITYVSPREGRVPDREDVALAEDLGARCAIALDNSRMHQEAQRARQAEAAANRAKSEFLSTMSHEIRTPINAIVGYVDLLEMGIAGPVTERQKEQLQRVRASGQHLTELIDDILDLAKVEAGRLNVEHERALAAIAISGALALVHPQAAAKEIDIQYPGDDTSTAYIGDEDRVRQILVNLLSNAVKFTEPGGEILITCGTDADASPVAFEERPGTFIRVQDTGVGIAPEQVENVFRPFTQVQGGHTRRRGGTGLGLTISRQLARLMGGDLTLESEPGVGSTFTLWLPSEAVHRPPLEEAVLDEMREARPRGLAAVGEALHSQSDTVRNQLVARLRADSHIPATADVEKADLEDHASTLLADIAQSLVILERSRATPERLLRDGSQIQRVICELHGAQRAQLGWTEEALRREWAILRDEIQTAVQRDAPADSDIPGALRLLVRFLEQAERISDQSLRRARAAGMPEL